MKRDMCRIISIYSIFISIFLTIVGCESTKSTGSTNSGSSTSKGTSTPRTVTNSTDKKVVVTPSTPVVQANLALSLEREIFSLVNDYRKTKKLPPLQTNAAIEYQARRHSMDMGTHRIPFGHQGLSFRIKYIQEKVARRYYRRRKCGVWQLRLNVASGWIKKR